MFWRLFAQGAESRVAFPGVAALYRALHGDHENPILYVSRGPWSIYSMLVAFFVLHGIPVGPILFLRDWGLSLSHPLPRASRGHKLNLIREMLAVYSHLPFVLIGDSGQHDPETYAQVVRENPQRVAAVFIRRQAESGGRGARETRLVRRHTREETQRAVARHAIDQSMDGPEDEPPNTLVEAESNRDHNRDVDGDRG